MGKFFRDFDDRPQSSSSSMIVLLMGIIMFGGAAWLVTLAVNGSPMDSIMAVVDRVMAR